MADQMWTAGSVTVTNGSANVSGSGTGWQTAGVRGGLLMQAGLTEGIESVESETSLTLSQPWAGPTATGNYSILRSTSDAASVVDLYDRLSKALVTLSMAGIHPNAAGTLTKRDALTLGVDDDGFLFLHAEIGVAFVYYLWDGTSWEGPFPVAAPGTPGASGVLNWITDGWETGGAYEINDGLPHLGSSYRCFIDHTATSLTEPGVGADWETVWQVTAAKGDQGEPGADGAGSGDVVGPSSSVDNHVALFNGTTGKLLKSAGVLFSSLASVTYVDGLFTALRNGVSASFDTLAEIATDLGLKMVKSANLSDVANAATAFNNIKQAATTSATGAVELATDTEVTTGTDTSRAVTPAGAKLAAQTHTPATKASFKAYLPSDQSGIVSATQTILNFTTEAFDVGNFYDAANKRWVPPAGKVIIGLCVRCTAGNVDQSDFYLIINKNNSAILVENMVRTSGTGSHSNFVMVVDEANGTDYYDARVWIGGAGTKTIGATTHFSYFFGYAA